MNSILLISEDYLKTNSNLNSNAFGKWILPAIRESQEMGLMPIIGECLYDKICELVGNGLIDNELYAAYKDLLDEKIQPYLLYQTLTNIVPILNGKMANIGTVATNDEHIVTLSQGELDLTQNYYRERADFYAKRLQDWVKNNKQAFPELECVCSITKPNLDSAANSVGLWLGGSRGKIVKKRDCGCGSSAHTDKGSYLEGFADGFNEGMQSGYTSGVTDGIDIQKDKLATTAFTENGTYVREDGWNNIQVNVAKDRPCYLDSAIFSLTGASEVFYPEGNYDGFANVEIDAVELCEEYRLGGYQEGYTDGYAEGASGTCNLQTKNVTISGDSQTVYPDNGYNGMSRVNIDASGYGATKYQEGYADGRGSCTGSSCNLQSKNVAVTSATQTITPDSGFDGLSAVNLSSSALCNDFYELGIIKGREETDPDYWNAYSRDYLSVEALTGGVITLGISYEHTESGSVYYSKNNGEWIYAECIYDALDSDPNRHINISVSKGDVIRFKNSVGNLSFEPTTTPYKVYGNIMSLDYGDDFSAHTETFYRGDSMFYKSNVIDAENLILPSSAAANCYHMFADCGNLEIAPRELRATHVSAYGYNYMFKNCTKLLMSPDLPDVSYGQGAMEGMFSGCTSLRQIKCLATNILDSLNQYVTENWMSGVPSTGRFIKKSNMNAWPRNDSGIPADWIVINA